MRAQSPGMRRYLYEYLFHSSVQRAQEHGGKVISVSGAVALRADVERRLVAAGTSMEDPHLGISPVLSAIEGALSQGVAGYSGTFVDGGPQDRVYLSMRDDFCAITGLPGGATTQRSVGLAAPGPRLPISPYDPRWSIRSTVKNAGSALLYASDEMIERDAGGSVSRLAALRSPQVYLYRLAEDSGRLTEAGRALTLDDISGMTELMGRMSEAEYRDVRSHVIEGARRNGSLDFDAYMSREALGRARAVLDELAASGTPYTVKRDRNPGQIKAELDGTKMSVRLTEPRSSEQFVGRVYDNGVATYYATSYKPPGSQRTVAYTPSAPEAVNLLRVAQGKAVQRADGTGEVGTVGTHVETAWSAPTRQRVPVIVQDSSFSETDKSSMRLVGPLLINGAVPQEGAFVFVRRDASARSVASTWFSGPDATQEYLIAAVRSARENLLASLEVDVLVATVEENEHRAEAVVPDFSGDPEVAAVQRAYWDVLTGVQTTLLRPGASEQEYQESVGVLGDLQLDEQGAQRTHDMLVAAVAYVGTPEQRIRAHALDAVDAMVGTYEPRPVLGEELVELAVRFNPAQVAKRMSSEFGQWRNQGDLVAAMKEAGIAGGELMGTGFYTRTIRDRLIAFDDSSAMSFPGFAAQGSETTGAPEVSDPFLLEMGEVIKASILRNGGELDRLQIDGSGIVRYHARRFSRRGEPSELTGEIGQLFAPGEHGEVQTGFASGADYLFVPGYEARISAQRPGEDLSVEERTKLRGYAQVMTERIEYQVCSDLTSMRSVVGESTSLNGVYRGLYDVRHEVDFLESAGAGGLSREWAEAILATESRRVRYPSSIASGSTVHAAWREANGPGTDLANDNRFDPWVLTGRRNMAIMTQESDGYFDPVMTNGALYQGITRYLVEGVVVEADGSITPGDPGDRAPLMKMPATATMAYDPYDRQQMSASNLLNAAAVTSPVGVAMMTFGGWTADDPMVVSKEFAARYGVRGPGGERVDLVAGDKLSDLHGNKGVISLVVDREMSADEAAGQGLGTPHAIFSANPGLDVVMSPFSAVSRFNGGSARDLMAGEARPVSLPGGQVLPGAMGTMALIVTHKDARSGTRVYGDVDLAEGRGRKASGQLAWALGSQDCEEVMAEFYGPNNSSIANLREMLVTMGLDLEPDGTLRVGYDDLAPGAARRLFELPALVLTTNGTSLNTRRMRADFGALIGDKGGDLEIPFPLRMPSGELTPAASGSSWALPVMSSHLRSGRDLDDGVSTTHDYTNQYLSVHEMSCRYRHAQEALAGEDLSPGARAKHEQTLSDAPRRAQGAFDVITGDLATRRFCGRRNVFKEMVMAAKLPSSATAVWTSDPRLDIDQLGMGPAMAAELSLKEGDYALVWRDPVLRDGGVRYLRVTLDDRLTGVSINPVADKSFDGDFDGDAVAVVRLGTEGAREQAMARLSTEANLLDLGQFDEVEGQHPLFMQDALDSRVSQHLDPVLTQRLADLRREANDVLTDREEGSISAVAARDANRAVMARLSDYYRDAHRDQYGGAALRFGDAGDHVRSVVESCVETKAKGSMAKVGDYCRHLGVDPVTMEDLGTSAHTREEDQGVMMATAVKSHGTGVAGMFSQRGVKALRGQELKAVLELTYPVTQSVLQSKHDPVEAEHKYSMLMGPVRQLWRGRLLHTVAGPDGGRAWEMVRDNGGREVQASPQRWKEQFVDLYTAADGLNVSINRANVDLVAEALTDAGTGAIRDIEDDVVSAPEALGSTMDRLAYGGTFADVLSAASKKENLFSGSENVHFAPHMIRRNMAAMEVPDMEHPDNFGRDLLAERARDTGPEPGVLANKDVLPGYDPDATARKQSVRTQVARPVRMPRSRPIVTTADAGVHVYEEEEISP